MTRLRLIVFFAAGMALSSCGKSPSGASQDAYTPSSAAARKTGVTFGSGNRTEVGADSIETAAASEGDTATALERGGLTLGSGN